ncbi:DNA-3-methyladenine glycosylase family protein [Microseira wollei]|uniref:DNA-3-methyladenine glycosylase II n=1 Tax=Microseira wollei NIES-4236 TaxID=2530354 RepID=A0AAV3XGT6_9CYAN|nr:DNA-3-methyladenine glycosylase [Microseira wollei]GET41629.1 HhH-GPD family protein [Microseira wollei NIES-4236]
MLTEFTSLTPETIAHGVGELASRDRDLARIVEQFGYPPNWQCEPGFIGLIETIVGQQVSVASAKAIFKRLSNIVVPLTPENLLTYDDLQLQAAGLSRQKISYCRGLAQAITNGKIDLDKLALEDAATIRTELKQIKGIGDWTVDNYLLMSLQRPDVFPKGDLGLIVAYQKLKSLATRPTPKELEKIAEKWRPWRAIAARLLWHYYLSIPTKI